MISSAGSWRWTEPLVARHRQHPPLPVRPPRSGQGPRLTQGLRPVREAPPCDSRWPAASSCPGPSQREARVPQEGGRAVREQGVNKPVLPLQPEVKASISHFMAYVHTTVNEMSKVYLATERRYNYTTPKTFLEQIKLYQNLLAKKRMELVAKIERLENGLMKLQSTASQVGRAGPRRRVPEPSPAPPPPHAPHARTHARTGGRKANSVPAPQKLRERALSQCQRRAERVRQPRAWLPSKCVHPGTPSAVVPRRKGFGHTQCQDELSFRFSAGF